MRTPGKILAGICAALFIITGVLALFLFNIERTAFSARTYKQAFEKQQIYQRMPSILATALTGYVAENPNADPFLKTIDQPAWERTIVLLVPPEELKALTDQSLDSVFDYVNGKTDSAVISLAPFKGHLAGAEGVEAVKQLLQVQPSCTAEQLFQLGLGLLQGNIGLCNPPAELMGVMTPLIESQLQVIVGTLPDTITLTPGNMPDDARVQLNRVRTLMKLTLILPILFLLGLVILTARTPSDLLQWIGIPFIITGGVGTLIALLSAPTMSLLLVRILQNRATSLPGVFLSIAQETVGVVSQQILAPIVVEGGLLAMAGIAMLLVMVYLSSRGKTAIHT